MLKDEKKTTASKLMSKQQALDTLVIILGMSFTFIFGRYSFELDLLSTIAFSLVLLALLYYAFYTTKRFYKKELDKMIFNSIEMTDDKTKEITSISKEQKENLKDSFIKIKNSLTTVDDLRESLISMDKMISDTKYKTTNSLEKTNEEHIAVKANIEKMFVIRHKMQTIAELILELSEFIQSISSTIGTVEDIAEQTNLLALNAAVEAARAGEHGKGFAVVAGEIRKLADESKQATTKIASLITDIQQTTNSTVIATEEGTKEIESGIDLAHSIGTSVEKLIETISEISSSVADINRLSDSINKDTNKTNSFIKEINSVLELTNKTVDNAMSELDNINSINKGFKNMVAGE